MDFLVLILLIVLLGILLVTFMTLRGLIGRISTVEQNQSQTSQNINALETKLVETGTAAKSLVETTSAIRSGLEQARENLASIQAHAKARQDLERQTSESIRRLEGIIAGTQTKGVAGENIVEVVFAQLPSEWQVRDFKVGNKTVEFGLRLPNNLVLPIDSKWAATNLLEQFLATENLDEQQKLKSDIEKAVLAKAKEVRKYIDPNITVDFAVPAVPDAIYDLCARIQVEAFQINVVLVSYSMFVPYLLLVFQTILKTSQTVDVQRLNAYVQSVQSNIEALQDELEGRLSRAVIMMGNSRDEMRAHLSKISAGLTSLEVSAETRALELTETSD